jgi:hypothetical protein
VFEKPPLFNPSPLLMLLFPTVVLLPPNMLPPGMGLVALFSRGPMRALLLGNWFKLADFLTSDSARAGGCFCCCCWRAWASSCSLSNLQKMITYLRIFISSLKKCLNLPFI